MKYFLDTEFLEGPQKKLFGYTKPTIDLISVGICSSDGREFYAISKEFNLKEAWNRYDIKKEWYSIDESTQSTRDIKVYWIRENILKPIFDEWNKYSYHTFNYKNMKYCVNMIGKTNKQIAEEILDFVNTNGSFVHKAYNKKQKNKVFDDVIENYGKPQFYGYYSDYDWVVFCWLFGRMIDLPKNFPMVCVDLKQELDNKVNNLNWLYLRDTWNNSRMSIKTIGKGDSQEKDRLATFDEKLRRLKELYEYPKQINEHNALADARWNKKLYEFLENI